MHADTNSTLSVQTQGSERTRARSFPGRSDRNELLSFIGMLWVVGAQLRFSFHFETDCVGRHPR